MKGFVSYSQAGELKELGFNWVCNTWYNTNGELCTKSPQKYPAPTLSQVQKWLREVKGLKVYIGVSPNRKFNCYIRNLITDCSLLSALYKKDSYNQALSEGIDQALEFANYLFIEKN